MENLEVENLSSAESSVEEYNSESDQNNNEKVF